MVTLKQHENGRRPRHGEKCETCGSKSATDIERSHDMLIMRKMHETQLEVKNRLIKNLEDIIDEQEARIFNLESHLAGTVTLSFST